MYIYIYICILCSIILSSHFPPKKNVLYHLPRVFLRITARCPVQTNHQEIKDEPSLPGRF